MTERQKKKDRTTERQNDRTTERQKDRKREIVSQYISNFLQDVKDIVAIFLNPCGLAELVY
jgi:hypothetical protein